jgi:hypothetical protein
MNYHEYLNLKHLCECCSITSVEVSHTCDIHDKVYMCDDCLETDHMNAMDNKAIYDTEQSLIYYDLIQGSNHE